MVWHKAIAPTSNPFFYWMEIDGYLFSAKSSTPRPANGTSKEAVKST
jgi:hypothetical protein